MQKETELVTMKSSYFDKEELIWRLLLLIQGGDSNVGLDLGKNLISVYRYNQSGWGNAQLGSYNKQYFSHNGSGVFTCKKECSIKIIAIACAVIGYSETSFNLYYNGNTISSVSKGGGTRVHDITINVGSTLSLNAWAERVNGSAVLNVYLK